MVPPSLPQKKLLIYHYRMAVVHEYPPNYAASFSTYATPKGPVYTSGYWPPGTSFVNRINGLMNCVFAYGGATLFNELMAEMRRPCVKNYPAAPLYAYRRHPAAPLCSYRNLANYVCRYDFWKGFIFAEIFIFACYLVMGLVVYSA